VLCYLPHSPFMQLLVVEAGVEVVATTALTAPDEFQDLINTMKAAFDQASRIAVDSPAEALMIPENLSSEMVGPDFFEQYMRGFQTEWVEKIKEAGKYSFVHMDGTLAGLLRQQSSVGFTVLEALTPHPVGDIKIEDFQSRMGNSESIVWGGIPGSYFTANVSDQEFDRHVRYVLSVMSSRPRYVLGVADQVPPDALEGRVRRVAELVDIYGKYSSQ
jgi:uroporphyrinogen-III decarboxylase